RGHGLEGVAQGDRGRPDGLRLDHLPVGHEAALSPRSPAGGPGRAGVARVRGQSPTLTVPGKRADDRSVIDPSPAALISAIIMTRSRSELAARARPVASWYGSVTGFMS